MTATPPAVGTATRCEVATTAAMLTANAPSAIREPRRRYAASPTRATSAAAVPRASGVAAPGGDLTDRSRRDPPSRQRAAGSRPPRPDQSHEDGQRRCGRCRCTADGRRRRRTDRSDERREDRWNERRVDHAGPLERPERQPISPVDPGRRSWRVEDAGTQNLDRPDRYKPDQRNSTLAHNRGVRWAAGSLAPMAARRSSDISATARASPIATGLSRRPRAASTNAAISASCPQ